jgi:phosphoserine phosphatase
VATRILLARHGESDWNAEGRWQGHADRPLSGRGRRQALELADRLARVELDAIYASDLRRAWETAEVVARSKQMAVTRVSDLREVDVGSWSGLTRAEVSERFPEGFAAWRQGGTGWTDGETYDRMGERVLSAVRRVGADHPNGTVLIVSHGGAIRAVHSRALGIAVGEYRRHRPVEPNAGLSTLALEHGELDWCDPPPGLD